MKENTNSMYKRNAFYLAESFHMIAQNAIPDDFQDNDEDTCRWFIPFLVNLAFACELYLKVMLFAEVETSGHDLRTLFKKLPQNKQDQILNSPEFRGSNTFEESLMLSKDVFTSWRYIYETNNSSSVDVVFLENFAVVLHRIVEQEVNGL